MMPIWSYWFWMHKRVGFVAVAHLWWKRCSKVLPTWVCVWVSNWLAEYVSSEMENCVIMEQEASKELWYYANLNGKLSSVRKRNSSDSKSIPEWPWINPRWWIQRLLVCKKWFTVLQIIICSPLRCRRGQQRPLEDKELYSYLTIEELFHVLCTSRKTWSINLLWGTVSDGVGLESKKPQRWMGISHKEREFVNFIGFSCYLWNWSAVFQAR